MPQGPNFYNDPTLDLWVLTRATFPWKNKHEVFNKYPDYPILNRIWPQFKHMVGGGTRVEWRAMIDDTGHAHFTTPMTPQTYDAVDIWGQFNAIWKLQHDYYLVTDDEVRQNSGEDVQLENLLQGKRMESACSTANLLEESFWKCPASEDAPEVLGVPYSIVPITSDQAGASQSGFIGANAAGFSTCYGVNSATARYARYRNWVDRWTNGNAELTEDDALKITRMIMNLRWTPPANAKQFESDTFGNTRLFTTEAMILSAEKKKRGQNDNLGADIGPFRGQTVSKGIAWQWAPALDSLSTMGTNPLVAIDFRSFMPIVATGDDMNEIGPTRLQQMSRVMKTDVWLKYNYVNRNRRRCGCIAWVA